MLHFPDKSLISQVTTACYETSTGKDQMAAENQILATHLEPSQYQHVM